MFPSYKFSLSKTDDKKPPEILYHYTSAEGLMGILSTGKVRATSLSYLNDSKEFSYGMEASIPFLESLREGLTPVQLDFLNDAINWLKFSFQPHIFIASFSEEPDLLSQWRSYCPNGGYAIGFKSDLITNAGDDKFAFHQCRYGTEGPQDAILQLIKQDLEIIEEMIQSGKDEQIIKPLGFRLKMELMKTLPIMKHESFKEEAEWRLFSKPGAINDKEIEYRTKNALLIPYFEVDLKPNDRLRVEQIYIGPMPHAEAAQRSLNSFIGKWNLDIGEMIFSKTPYRHW